VHKLSLHIVPALLLGSLSLFQASAQQRQATSAKQVNRPEVTWLIKKDSHLSINGKSNFGAISCHNTQFRKADSIAMYNSPKGDTIDVDGGFYLDVVDFSCHNFFYTYNLRKTLKMAEYPQMTVRLLKLDRMLPLQDGAHCMAASLVEICLAGMCRQFMVPVEFASTGAGHAWLKGARTFRLEDFRLQSPVKAGGLIRVKNEFVVEFKLFMDRL
jgi:hypothetical protein